MNGSQFSVRTYFSESFQNFGDLPAGHKAFYGLVSAVIGVAAGVFFGLIHPSAGVVGVVVVTFVSFTGLCSFKPDPKKML